MLTHAKFAEHLDQIEKDNATLLRRMAHQMSNPSGISNLDSSHHIKDPPRAVRLSKVKKCEIHERIHKENETNFQRVEDQEPNYRHEEYLNEHKQSIVYLQNISRFPESYFDHNTDVEKPKSRKLSVRFNRTHFLKQNIKNAKVSPEPESNETKLSEGETNRRDIITQRLKIHLTRSHHLRVERTRLLKESPDAQMRLKRLADLARKYKEESEQLTQQLESEGEGTANEQKQKSPLVRLNRAQRLRLEEQEQTRLEVNTEKWREQHKVRLGHVEARIDFGQGGGPGFDKSRSASVGSSSALGSWSRTQSGDQLNSMFDNLDPLDDPGTLFDHLVESERLFRDNGINTSFFTVSWIGVFTGISALRVGAELPDRHPSSVRIFWCSEGAETVLERQIVLESISTELRGIAQENGLDFLIRDLCWGVDNADKNPCSTKVQYHELETSLKESVGVNCIIFLGSKTGQKSLPQELPMSLFDRLLTVIENSNTTNMQLLQSCYKLDRNYIQPHYLLQNLQDDSRLTKSSYEDVIEALSEAVQHLNDMGVISYEELDAVSPCLQSELEASISCVISGPVDNSVLIRRILPGQSFKLEDLNTIDSEISESETIDSLDQIARKLVGIVPQERIITKKVSWNQNTSPSRKQKDEYTEGFQEHLCDLLSQCIERAVENFPSTDDLKEEVLQHVSHFQERLKSSIGYVGSQNIGRLATFIEGYLTGTKHQNQSKGGNVHASHSIHFPMAVVGKQGAGKSERLIQAINHLIVKPRRSHSHSVDNLSDFNPIMVVRFIGLTACSTSATTLMSSICQQIRRALYLTAMIDSQKPSANDQPARRSSVSISSFQPKQNTRRASLLDIDKLPNNYSALCDTFKDVLCLASKENPILIALFALDKLADDDNGNRLGWIPFDGLPPYVQIVLTVTSEINSKPTKVFEYFEMRLNQGIKCFQESLGLLKQSSAKDEEFTRLKTSSIINVDYLDIIDVHVALKMWMKETGRMLQPYQYRFVMHNAFPSHSNSLLKSCPPLLLRLMYFSQARHWHSWSYPDPDVTDNRESLPFTSGPMWIIGSSIGEIINKGFHKLETLYGEKLIQWISILITATRESGISESELEDVLSLVDEVVLECAIRGISTLHLISGGTPDDVKDGHVVVPARVPPFQVSRVMYALDIEFQWIIKASPKRGMPLLVKWRHEEIRRAAEARFLRDDNIEKLTRVYAEYLTSEWVTGKLVDGLGNSSLKFGSKRYVPMQYTDVSPINASRPVFNLRKLRELPKALVLSKWWDLYSEILQEYTFLEGKLSEEGIHQTLKELLWSLREGRKPNVSMPLRLQELVGFLIFFVRRRCNWISEYECDRAKIPTGLWMQEFENFPLADDFPEESIEANFASLIHSFLEDNRGDLDQTRVCRLEYDSNWRLSEETYQYFEFHQRNLQCLAVSSDGRWLGTGSSDSVIKVLDLATSEELWRFELKAGSKDSSNMSISNETPGSRATSGIIYLSFSTDRQYLMAAVECKSQDSSANSKLSSSLKLWSLKTGQMIKHLTGGHKANSRILQCNFIPPDNRRILSIASDNQAVVWEVARGKVIKTLTIEDSPQPLPQTVCADIYLSNVLDNAVANVSESGSLFCFGSSSITVHNSKWKRLWTKSSPSTDHSLSGCVFSSDNSLLFASFSVSSKRIAKSLYYFALKEELIYVNSSENPISLDVPGMNPQKPNTMNSAFHEHDVAQEYLKKVAHSFIKCYRAETGDVIMSISIDDSISTMTYWNGSDGSKYLLYGSSSGVMTALNACTGDWCFSRTAHASRLKFILPIHYNPNTGGTLAPVDVLSLELTGGGFVTCAESEDSALLWLKLHTNELNPDDNNNQNAKQRLIVAGQSPITHVTFSQDGGKFMLSVGGSSKECMVRGNTLIRVWDTISGKVLLKTEFANTKGMGDIVYAEFIPTGNALKQNRRLSTVPGLADSGTQLEIMVACRNGLVRVIDGKSGEVVKEMWLDVEQAIGVSSGQPFFASVVQTQAVSFNIHPTKALFAAAIAGWARPTAKNGVVPAALNKMVMITFWDFEGNPFAVDFPELLEIVYSGNSFIEIGTNKSFCWHRPFVLAWTADGKSICVSDDSHVLIECFVEFRVDTSKGGGNRNRLTTGQETQPARDSDVMVIRGQTTKAWQWRSKSSPAPASAATCASSKIVAPSSMSMQSSSDITGEYLCFGFDGAIYVHRRTSKGIEFDTWLTGHWRDRRHGSDSYLGNVLRENKNEQGQFCFPTEQLECGRHLISVYFVPGLQVSTPGVASSGGLTMVRTFSTLARAALGAGGTIAKPDDGVVGIVISASRDGQVVVQDTQSRRVCALFHAGRQLLSMAVISANTRDGLRIALGGTEGFITVLRLRL
ncbi:hypothetical protein BJ742DRAFT_808080 [Cladochytrium replicatum]|nr:hypothetical protein BJ742DRAFT_808080 [Cladochytrium replicatum]